MSAEALPMFPLGTVLFPSMLLPLRIFEPRYRTMIRHCLDTDRRFGVVLIERGHEVGGGDVRSDVGCAATVMQAEEQRDGQWLLMALGTSRIRVVEWLEDDPYPRARVEPWCVAELGGSPPMSLELLVSRFRRVLAMAAELDAWSVPFGIELSDDPVVALYQMCGSAPLGPFDRQSLLRCADVATLAERLNGLLEELTDTFERRLAES